MQERELIFCPNFCWKKREFTKLITLLMLAIEKHFINEHKSKKTREVLFHNNVTQRTKKVSPCWSFFYHGRCYTWYNSKFMIKHINQTPITFPYLFYYQT